MPGMHESSLDVGDRVRYHSPRSKGEVVGLIVSISGKRATVQSESGQLDSAPLWLVSYEPDEETLAARMDVIRRSWNDPVLRAELGLAPCLPGGLSPKRK